MDKIGYAIAICAGMASIAAGHVLDVISLRIIGGFLTGLFTVRLARRG